MYTPAPVTIFPAPVARRPVDFTVAPIVVICYLIIILFFIAATIIIALIPMYLPRKETTQRHDSSAVYYISTEDNNGVLDKTVRAAIAQQIATSLNLAPSSVVVENGIAGLQVGRQKRRQP